MRQLQSFRRSGRRKSQYDASTRIPTFKFAGKRERFFIKRTNDRSKKNKKMEEKKKKKQKKKKFFTIYLIVILWYISFLFNSLETKRKKERKKGEEKNKKIVQRWFSTLSILYLVLISQFISQLLLSNVFIAKQQEQQSRNSLSSDQKFSLQSRIAIAIKLSIVKISTAQPCANVIPHFPSFLFFQKNANTFSHSDI